MAKKRKDKKFSKTKQRKKSKIRSEVDAVRGRLSRNDLASHSVKNYLNGLGYEDLSGSQTGGVQFSLQGSRAFNHLRVTLYDEMGMDEPEQRMHINMTRATPKGEPELNDALRAIMEGDGTQPIPTEIDVSAKSGSEDVVKKQLEQLVADMNEEARDDKTKPQYRLVQISATPVQIRSGIIIRRQVNIQFRLTPIGADEQPLTPVMSSAELREGLGKNAKETGSPQYTNMLAALNGYHKLLADFPQNLDDINDIIDRLQQVKGIRNQLLTAAKAYLNIHRGNRDSKKNAAERLVEQVEQFQPNSLLEAPLRRFVNQLPNVPESHATIENIEQQLVGNPGDSLLTVSLHEMFFRKKTEILENVVEGMVKNTQHIGLSFLENFGKENYWKLLIDGKVHKDNNKHLYDKSRGYMAAMMNGLRMVVGTIQAPLSTDFVISLHKVAVTLVTTERAFAGVETPKPSFPVMPGSFQEDDIKKAPNTWGVIHDFSEKGMEELKDLRDELDRYIEGGYFDKGEMVFKDKPDIEISWKAGKPNGPLSDNVKSLMRIVIEKAYREIEVARQEGNNDGIVGAIVDSCRSLGIIHPFRDGNGRLIMFLVLNKMLMEQGLSPTILNDQGVMVGKSKAELIEIIKAGQQAVRNMSAIPQQPAARLHPSVKGKEDE